MCKLWQKKGHFEEFGKWKMEIYRKMDDGTPYNFNFAKKE